MVTNKPKLIKQIKDWSSIIRLLTEALCHYEFGWLLEKLNEDISYNKKEISPDPKLVIKLFLKELKIWKTNARCPFWKKRLLI